MKIIKLEKMPTFPWRSPRVILETEEEAQVWARDMGANVLYYYVQQGKNLWLVKADLDKNDKV